MTPTGVFECVALSYALSNAHLHPVAPSLLSFTYPPDGRRRACVCTPFFLRFRSRSSEKRVDDNQNREFITVAYMGYSWWRRKNYTPVFGFATGSRLDRLSRGEVPICLHLTPATRRKEAGTHKFGH